MKAIINCLMKGALSGSVLLTLLGCSLLKNSPDPSKADDSSPSNLTTSKSDVAVVAESFKKTIVVEGLEHPWSMAWLPNGTMLITERSGRLRILRNGVLDPKPIAGVPKVFAVGQGGLMDVSIHPRFSENRQIYLTYSHGTRQANRTRVARATFDGNTLSNLRVIFEVSQTKSGTQHFGSRIIWLPDGTMLVAIGDGGNPPLKLEGDLIRKQAQNLRSHLGKIVRLNDDGSVPNNNPFVKSANGDPAVWSYGHRNIQGIAFDRANDRVWSTEHGARGGDELNLVEPGKNYGWPKVTHSREYSGGEISKFRSLPGMVDPKIVWTPAIAPSGLAFYTGDRFSGWKGDLFAGGLVSKDIRRIDLDAEGNAIARESISIGKRVRDVRQSPDGLLYVLTDESKGQLLRIEPDRP